MTTGSSPWLCPGFRLAGPSGRRVVVPPLWCLWRGFLFRGCGPSFCVLVRAVTQTRSHLAQLKRKCRRAERADILFLLRKYKFLIRFLAQGFPIFKFGFGRAFLNKTIVRRIEV